MTVDDYLAAVPPERAEAMALIRRMCLEELTGFAETIMYGMPTYTRDGVGEVAFASQKQYISIYLMRTDVRDAHADRLVGHDMGKSCLRLRRPDRLDADLVRSMLRATAAARGPVC